MQLRCRFAPTVQYRHRHQHQILLELFTEHGTGTLIRAD